MKKLARYPIIVIVAIAVALGFFLNFNTGSPYITYAYTLDDHGQLPGEFVGTGTNFDIQRSNDKDITIKFDQETQAHVQSITGMVGMRISPTNESRIITISNLEPSTTYYKYVDHLDTKEEIVTDETGSVTFQEDTTSETYVMLFTHPSTYFIEDNSTGEDCNSIGSWNNTTKTCTLNQNITQSIEIKDNGITLDGANHTVQGPDSNIGVYVNGGIFGDITDVTVKKITVQGFSKGIQINNTQRVHLINVTSRNNADGVEFYRAETSSITNSTITNNTGKGLIIGNSSHINDVSNNTINSNRVGVDLGLNSQSSISKNDIKFNGNGMGVGAIGGDNTFIWQNNFDNTNQVAILFDGDTQFNKPVPLRGNFWSDHTGIACSPDAINPNICTNAYTISVPILTDKFDNFPWSCEDGWLPATDCSVSTPTPSGSGTPTPTSTAPPSTNQVISLAEDVLGAQYLWGGKGYDYASKKYTDSNTIKNIGYRFWNPFAGENGAMDVDTGLDCSGLSMWTYNRAQNGGDTISWTTCVINKNCPIYYEGAHGQYSYNTDEIMADELEPGDLIFFDTDNNGFMDIDHMGMYIGGAGDNVIHASGYTNSVTYAHLDTTNNVLTTTKGPGQTQNLDVTAYGRPKQPIIELEVTMHSPVHFIIEDPDGYTASRERQWEGPMEYIIRDIDDDGIENDVAVTGHRKLGEYKIYVFANEDASPNDTYTLTARAFINGSWMPITLAENVPVSEIPNDPYIIGSMESSIEPLVKHKVTICHIPPGNPSNAHTISIGESAIKAHLKHGDYEGECTTDNKHDNIVEDGTEKTKPKEGNKNEVKNKNK